MSVQTIHFLRPAPPKKEYTSNVFECQRSPWNNKNQAKKLKVYRKNVDFHMLLKGILCQLCTDQ